MHINSTEPDKTVIDYDIYFDNGSMAFTIDASAGDTITEDERFITVKMVAKPSLKDPDKLLSAEETKIYASKVIAIQKRERTITPLTPEEKDAFAKFLKEVNTSSTLH